MVAAERVWQQQIFGTAQSRFDSSFLGQNRDISVICIESREQRYLSLVCQQFIFKHKYLGGLYPQSSNKMMQDTCKYCRNCLQCIPNDGQKAKKREHFSQPATFTSGPTISKRGQQLFSNNVLKKCRGGILCRQFKCPNRPTGPQRDAAAAGTPNCGSISSSSLNGPVEIFLGTFSTLKVVFLLEIT